MGLLNNTKMCFQEFRYLHIQLKIPSQKIGQNRILDRRSTLPNLTLHLKMVMFLTLQSSTLWLQVYPKSTIWEGSKMLIMVKELVARILPKVTTTSEFKSMITLALFKITSLLKLIILADMKLNARFSSSLM